MFIKRIHLITIANIKIGIDISWFFIATLLSWTLATAYFPSYTPNLSNGVYWIMGISGMLGLFVCVLLHEMGHAFVAKHYGLPISNITLFLFGGIAEIKKEPKSPKVEFFVAVAGPIVSLALALLFYFFLFLAIQKDLPASFSSVLGYLAMINILVVLFNLIPAFPLDGGRILRAAIWAFKKDLRKATTITASLGIGFGFLLLFLGLLSLITGNFVGGIWWIILGWFLQRAATSSQTQLVLGEELTGKKAESFMKEPISVPCDISVDELVHQHIYHSLHHFYPVTKEDSLLGYVSLDQIKTLSKENWKKVLVGEIMIPVSQFPTISPSTSILKALDLIQQTGLFALLVVEENRLVGLVTSQDVLKLINFKLELKD